jgi:hypothetical protein
MAGASTVEPLNGMQAVSVFRESPLKSGPLEAAIFGGFVRSAIEDGVTLEAARLSHDLLPQGNTWEGYLETNLEPRGCNWREYFTVGDENKLALQPSGIQFMRERLMRFHAYKDL